MKKFLMLLLLVACKTITPEQQSYIQSIAKTGNSITVPISKEREIWGKTEVFISNYASYEIQSRSDYVIETWPSMDLYQVAWKASKVVEGDSITITVRSWSRASIGDYFESKHRLNEHILINYLKTGSLPYPELIFR